MTRLGTAGVVGAVTVAVAVAATPARGTDEHGGDHGDRLRLTSVPANPKVAGLTVPNALSPELIEVAAAQGAIRLENGTADIAFYGYRG